MAFEGHIDGLSVGYNVVLLVERKPENQSCRKEEMVLH